MITEQTPKARAGSGTAPDRAVPARWLALARATWIAVTLSTLALFSAGVPVLFEELQKACTGPACRRPQLSPDAAQTLEHLGLSLRFYATYFVTMETLFVLTFCVIAVTLFRYRSSDPFALLGATMLVLVGGTVFTETVTALRDSCVACSWVITVLSFLGSASMLPFFYLFPDGSFVPRWTRLAAVAWVVLCALGYFTPSDFVLNQDPNNRHHVFPMLAFCFLASVVVAQGYRYQRISGSAERLQTRCVAFGFLTAFVGFFVGIFVIEPRIEATTSSAVVFRFLGLTDFYVFLVFIPLSLGVAMLRYHLWDIDILINRTLVYTLLTACIIGGYTVLVGAPGMLFPTYGGPLSSIIATGAIAVLFQPIRERLQRGVNHLMYGERDDPYTVVSRLGQRLELALEPGAVLPMLVETVATALKLPYVAITLNQDGDQHPTTAHGVPIDDLLSLPLTYGGQAIGQLTLAPRAPGESLSRADRRLLADLARQAGVAAHAVMLATALERSRVRIVTAREETRRRVGADLHDGLGHRLTGLLRHAELAENLLAQDPAAAQDILHDLKGQTRAAINEVRRLAHALHPPELELLGLVGALRECVEQSNGMDSKAVQVTMKAPEALPPLSAAVEVAAYYIAQEAMTNVHRHAAARHCTLRLRFVPCDAAGVAHRSTPHAPFLEIEVCDDGTGVGADRAKHGAGLGMTLMCERAVEVGGVCHVEALTAGGTRVLARLPCLEA